MSYQVLARKYRPRHFQEMVGQEHVARALTNALDQDRLHHAYLFTGTRGVGKTTIARILAKCLNCEQGVSSVPCGVCGTCREVDEGRFIDLIEVDAASRTKVEDTRELLENVQYAPTQGRYKVYLIDEVHMLSTSSFNALLKTLEEPPPHVKFLLATTEPQKLHATILSRCLQFSLMAMSPERIVGHLENVLEREMVAFDAAALWELGRAANGSMRDALSLTDQAIAFGNGRLAVAEVRSMLGSIDRDLVFRVLDAINSGDASSVLDVCAQLAEQSVDFSGALVELISTLHRVALAQVLPDAVDNTTGDRERVLAIAQASTAEDIQLYYQIAVQGRRDLPLAADLRSGFEMTLLRMLAFRPVPTRGTPKNREQTAPTGPRPAMRSSQGAPNQGPQAMAQGAVSAPATSKVPVTQGATAVASAALESSPKVAVVATQPASNVVTLNIPPRSVEAVAATTESLQAEALCTASAWEAWLQRSGLMGNGLNLARHAALVAKTEDVFELQISGKHELVATDSAFQQVESVFHQHFPGKRLQKTIATPAYMIPMQLIAERQKQRQADAERSLHDDPVVQMLRQDFQAEIIPDSISPIN